MLCMDLGRFCLTCVIGGMIRYLGELFLHDEVDLLLVYVFMCVCGVCV